MIEGERLILRLPTKDDENEILKIVNEFKASGEDSISGAGGVEKFENYQDWLNNLFIHSKKETLPEGRVLSTQFVSVRKSDNKIIGFVNLRHELNYYLLKCGGHIGDSVIPSERGKGYATEQIKLCLNYCKILGIKDVLITCKDWNIASRKTIIKNGGVFENTELDKDGNTLERYWINLD